jgi:hypothetical protein
MSKKSRIKKTKKAKENRVRLTVNRGISLCPVDMIEAICDRVEMEENWIELEREQPGRWKIVNDSMSDRGGYWVHDATELAFSSWDGKVENLDTSGEGFECFGISEKLRWENVTLTPKSISAPSIERIKEALEHVRFCAWCMGDI